MRGPMVDLYDIFIDWPGRLGREMPGLIQHLGDAQRVLDVGCGTGQHVAALRKAGFDAYGADASEEMLARAVERDRLSLWRMGDEIPGPTADAVGACPLEGPYDAVIGLGNVWPLITEPDDVDAALSAIHELLAPGGRLILGLKAFAARQAGNNPYLPLIRREHENRAVFFIRFLEPGEAEVANFHMVIAAGEKSHHRTGQVRIWSAESLRAYVAERGFTDVVVTHQIDGPPADESTEDVFLRARKAPPTKEA